MTKPFAAAAFLTLLDNGRVALDDPVAQYVPSFSNPRVLRRRRKGATQNPENNQNPNFGCAGSAAPSEVRRPCVDLVADADEFVEAKRPMTLLMLLTHTSGIGYGPGVEYSSPRNEVDRQYIQLCKATEAGQIPDLKCWVERLALIPLLHQPGEKFVYSYSIDVLGHILELVCQCSLSQCLQSHIFGPLGMADTSFAVAPSDADRLTTLHRLHKSPGPGNVEGRRNIARTLQRPAETSQPELEVVDRSPDSQWLEGRASPVESAGGGIECIRGGAVGTPADYLRFCDMLLKCNFWSEGVMDVAVRDQLSRVTEGRCREQKPGVGWTVLGAVNLQKVPTGQIGWGGVACTRFAIIPEARLAYVFFSQTFSGISPSSDIDAAVIGALRLSHNEKLPATLAIRAAGVPESSDQNASLGTLEKDSNFKTNTTTRRRWQRKQPELAKSEHEETGTLAETAK